MLDINSVLSIFKIGIGPSSSHTMGPMLIGKLFCEELQTKSLTNKVDEIKVNLYGSLSATGKGHLTDIAIMLGLSGFSPKKILTEEIDKTIHDIETTQTLALNGKVNIPFIRKKHIIFHSEFLDLHENGMTIIAYKKGIKLLEKTYFSTGGGFVVDKENFKNQTSLSESALDIDFPNAETLINLCKRYNKPIWEIVLMRELQFKTKDEIESYYMEVWEVMQEAISNGITAEGLLPGTLGVKRRAKALYKLVKLQDASKKKDDFYSTQWLSAHALAVSEENAAGHKVVTAPTTGACAIIPACMLYYKKFYHPADKKWMVKFLLTASAIGYLYKKNASISGAEAGCQAEVGVASSMAAVAMAEALGATSKQAAIAGEIAMEHHLGLTCDPVHGLVQVPCIERNAFGAVKAVMSAKMVLNIPEESIVSLDNIIEVMYQTGKDMNVKYRETSAGGLASVIKIKPLQAN